MALPSGSRDQTLTVGIKTTGEQALRDLSQEVRSLAKAGGDAAPAYHTLATELDRLADQAAGISAFKRLAADVDAFAERQREASATSTELQSKLALQQAETQRFAAAQAQAATELRAAQNSLQENRRALELLNAETTRADRTSASYVQTSQALRVAIVTAKDAVFQKRQALNDANAALSQAEAAESKLETAYNRSARAVASSAEALERSEAVMQQAGRAATALGVDLTDVAEAEQHLLAEQQRLISGASQAADYIRFWAQAADELAAREAEAAAQTQALAKAQQQGAIYAQELVEQEQRAAAALRETAAAATKANEAAAAAAQRADYIRFWAQAADELAEKEKKAAEQALFLSQAGERAGVALRDAFGQTGVRGLQAIQAEVDKVRASLVYLESQYRAGAIGAQDLARATSSAQVRLAQLRQEANSLNELPGVLQRINSSINDLVSRFGSLTAAIATVGFAVKPVLDVNIGLETLRRTLTAVTGSAAEAERQIAFLRETARTNGLAVGGLSESYSNFAASMLKAGIPVRDMQTLFSGVAAASGTLGISTERTGNILLALGQIANKGKVSLEELQGQIGEALPGALKLAADSVGLTTTELGKLLESGKLLSNDFLPAFGKKLVESFGGAQVPVKGLQQAFNDLKTEATVTLQKLADTSGYKLLTSALEGLARNFDTVVTVTGAAAKTFAAVKVIDLVRDFVGLKDVLNTTAAAQVKNAEATAATAAAERQATVAREAAAAATTAETAAVTANTAAKTANVAASAAVSSTGNLVAAAITRTGAAITATTARLGSFVAALGGLPGLALTVVAGFSEPIGKGIADLAARFTGLKGELDKQEADAKLRAEAERKRSEQRRQQNEQDQVSIQRLLVDTQKVIDQAEAHVKIATDLAEAKKIEGEATAELARLTGSEVRERTAAAEAARGNEQAQRALSAAYQVQIDAEIRQRQVLIENKGGVDNLNAAERERLRLLDLSIEKLEAKRKKVDEQVEKERALALAAQLGAEKLKDQSASLDENVKQLEVKREMLARLIQLEQQGVVSSETVTRARQDEAAATARVNEALRQKAERMLQEQQLRAADAQITRAKIDQNLAEERTLEELARANNDLITAEQSKIRQKSISLEATRAEIAAALDKARTDQEVAAQELATRQDLTEAQKRDLELKIKLAQASEMEAKARMQNVSATEAEIRALRNRAAAVSAGSATAGKIDGSGMGSFSASVSNPSGMMAGQGGGAVDNSLPFTLWAKFQAGQLTPGDLAAAQTALAVAKSNAAMSGLGNTSFAGMADDQMWITRLGQIVSAIEAMSNSSDSSGGTPYPTSKGSSATTATASAKATAATQQTSSGGTRVVQIQWGSKSASINTASSADADALESLLRALSQDAARAA